MSNSLNWTLKNALEKMGGDPPSSIPLIVWLLENPASPIALPGNIDLHRHDCLHCLLNRGFSLNDEAFVVGFTMGNAQQTQTWHLWILKIIAWLFYPAKYRFSPCHWPLLDLGFAYGRTVTVRDLNQLDFTLYYEQPLDAVRLQLGIDEQVLLNLQTTESILVTGAIAA